MTGEIAAFFYTMTIAWLVVCFFIVCPPTWLPRRDNRARGLRPFDLLEALVEADSDEEIAARWKSWARRRRAAHFGPWWLHPLRLWVHRRDSGPCGECGSWGELESVALAGRVSSGGPWYCETHFVYQCGGCGYVGFGVDPDRRLCAPCGDPGFYDGLEG